MRLGKEVIKDVTHVKVQFLRDGDGFIGVWPEIVSQSASRGEVSSGQRGYKDRSASGGLP
jgi:hypothetical protein